MSVEILGPDLAFVALGANLEDPVGNLLRAMTQLQHLSELPFLKSSLWQTTPVDCPPGSALFINAAVGFLPRKEETPESLLSKLQDLEKAFGRQPKTIANEPRPLDLDIIAFGALKRSSPELMVPHPRAHRRRFVLQPLSEIAPHLVLPGQAKTVARLLSELPPEETLRRIQLT